MAIGFFPINNRQTIFSAPHDINTIFQTHTFFGSKFITFEKRILQTENKIIELAVDSFIRTLHMHSLHVDSVFWINCHRISLTLSVILIRSGNDDRYFKQTTIDWWLFNFCHRITFVLNWHCQQREEKKIEAAP